MFGLSTNKFPDSPSASISPIACSFDVEPSNLNLFTKKFPKGPPSIQPEINPNVAAAIATSIAAGAPASTAIGANDAAFPCPPVIGILPVIIEISGSIFINLPTTKAIPF